jgi:hypothetical protein
MSLKKKKNKKAKEGTAAGTKDAVPVVNPKLTEEERL